MHVLLATLAVASLLSVAAGASAPATPPARATSAQDADDRDWETLETSTAQLQARVDAARMLAARAKKTEDAHKVAARFDELGSKFATDAQLRRILAESIAALDGPKTQEMLAMGMPSGQPFEKLFRLRAARGCQPGPVDEAALKLLADKDDAVRVEALGVLVHHGHAPALPKLRAILAAGKDPALIGPAIDAVTALIGQGEGRDAWEAELHAYAVSAHDEQRRTALAVLARGQQDPARLALFLSTMRHADWASRAIALGWLARSNSKEAVAAIIERFQHETPGGRPAADCGDTLRKMTGHPLGDDPAAWATWWTNVQATFVFPKASGPRTPGAQRPPPTSGTQAPQFYGIEVRSQRVVFVIDVSGSMQDGMAGADDLGVPRLTVAQRELAKIIDALPAGSLFNVISFNDGVVPWLDDVDEAAEVGSGGKGGGRGKGPATGPKRNDERDEKARAREAEKQKEADELLRTKAKEYVARLGAAGGTNIHDALEIAFEDLSADTIFLLSDGMPSIGREVDPAAIRAVVRRWNETRRLKINCIAVGQNLALLRDLAADSGGEYKHFP